jgi:hypothetical protein
MGAGAKALKGTGVCWRFSGVHSVEFLCLVCEYGANDIHYRARRVRLHIVRRIDGHP